MQEHNVQWVPGLVASADLSANQYDAVAHGSTSGQVAECADGKLFVGIMQNAPDAAGKPAKIAGPGSYCMATLASDISSGQYLKCTTGGALTIITADTEPVVAQAQRDGTNTFRVLVRVMDGQCTDFSQVQ